MDEIVVNIEDGGEETPPVVEPVVIETPAPANGTDPAMILTLEMLREEIATVRSENETLRLRVDSLDTAYVGYGSRISELEIAEIIEEVVEEDAGAEVVVETIPPDPENPEEAPKARKRKFI